MKFQFDDQMRARLLAIARRTFAWISAHKAGVVISLLLLYIFIWPKHVPQVTGTAAPGQRPDPAPLEQAASSYNPRQFAGDLPLYSPDLPGADAKWALPAQLQTPELQELTKNVDDLITLCRSTFSLETSRLEQVSKLMDDKVVNNYWGRLTMGGFKDKQLPLDWYELVKEFNGVGPDALATVDILANAGVQTSIQFRLRTISIRLVGGKVLMGDVLFVKSTKQYLEARHAYLQKLVDAGWHVVNRTQAEFPGTFDNQ